MHSLVWWMMGNSVKDTLCNRFEGSLRGKLCSAMFLSGLSRLGRNVLMLVGIVLGSCVISACVVSLLGRNVVVFVVCRRCRFPFFLCHLF